MKLLAEKSPVRRLRCKLCGLEYLRTQEHVPPGARRSREACNAKAGHTGVGCMHLGREAGAMLGLAVQDMYVHNMALRVGHIGPVIKCLNLMNE